MRDIVRQQSDDLSLPLTVCSSLDIFFLAPFLLAAVFLLLPDFSEIGFGGVALRRFQEKITETVEEASSRLETRISNAAGISKNIEKGLLLKGEIRNIELRMATIRTLLLSFVDEKDPQSNEILYAVGYKWGIDWSTDLTKVASQEDQTIASRQQLLMDWSYYDASAGLGSLRFDFDKSGIPSRVHALNSFAAISSENVDMRNLLGGYIAGTITGMFGRGTNRWRAELIRSENGTDSYSLAKC